MKNKLLTKLIIIGYVFLVITVGNCYAVQNNPSTTIVPNTPPPNTTTPSSSSNTTTTPNNQDITIANKLFEKAGYQYFQINNEDDSSKDHPEFFTIPSNTDDDEVDINNQSQ
jgi:hypothetical protein